jgi:hypothetical protein
MYQDSYDQEERDLNLHIAKMIEHMEWEATLPEAEKARRRLPRLISRLPMACQGAAIIGMPWVMLGQLERIIYNCRVLFGDECFEVAAKQRREFFEPGEFGDDDGI